MRTHIVPRPPGAVVLAGLVAVTLVLLQATSAAPARGPGNARRVARTAAPLAPAALTIVKSTNATSLVQCLLGPAVNVSNAVLNAAPDAAGTFTGGGAIIGFDSGIILSTGDVDSLYGPNDLEDTSTENLWPGDADLDTLVAPQTTYDAAILEFDFECTSGAQINIQFVFASEEYNEFVGSPFNDVFAVYLDGNRAANNIALTSGACAATPGLPIAVNNVNCGNPLLPDAPVNCGCFVDNTTASLDTEADGLTRNFLATANVGPGTHHMKIAIADTGDDIYDANVFLRCGSLACGIVPARPATWGEIKARYR
ncbi:MAG: choice-of-anchor L domain-containing protein [Candidatus Eisenbacteria bacterium]